jgi:hypothetical protein
MMNDEQVQVGEDRSLLTELWEAPVGRRSVLKAGLGSAAALGLGSMVPPVADAAPRRSKRRRVETTDLHFALRHARGVTGLTLLANGKTIPLVRHTAASRDALRRRGGLWQIADLSQLTHHVTGVKLPADRGILISVRGRRGRRHVLVAHAFYAPRAKTISHARASRRRTGSFKRVAGSSRRLGLLGLAPTQIRSALHVSQLGTVVDQYTTAIGLVSLHPNIGNVTLTAETNTTLSNTKAVTALGDAMALLQRNGKDLATFPTATNGDGSTAMINIPAVQNGKVVYTKTSFQTFDLNPQNDAGFTKALRSGAVAGVAAVRNNAQLGAVIDQPLDQDPSASTATWVQPQGVMAQAQPLTSARAAAAGIDIKVKNSGFWYGTQTEVTSGYSNGQVNVRLSNNFVRWVWVYVQYLGKDDTNLSANPGATSPDTKYAQSLGLLPQVFTLMGVPVWDTNFINVTLNYPAGAHTARILFCGLGSTLLDGGWRQYFPSDAYTDNIAPQDEVLVPGLLTGIFSIGLSAFALVTDADIAASALLLQGDIKTATRTLAVALSEVLRTPAIVLTASETIAASVAAGTATYEQMKANGGSTENIWNRLLSLGSLIPKILFNPAASPFWAKIASDWIGGQVGFDLAVSWIPLIGEVVSVMAAIGDAVTLAEALTETIISPWVIENQVTLTYPATITVNRSADPPDSTFPATARNWSLTAKVDGAVVLDPITGTVNPGGVLQSDPIAVPVTAPFGGEKIQWSIVFTTADGVQVGAGSSAEFTNNDPSNPPAAVSITITEIPPAIDASTVFKRTVTTGYSSAAGGYTWSGQLTDGGTVGSGGVQQVMGTTISTLAGVAGMVWEQSNRFYVRGVPIAQNGSTISLGKATNEGYVRRPFLLFDPFVERSSQGNHVLLEPDPSTNAYHVRKVSLDPTTGAPTWDPNTSYGDFLLPISAATLHSSGRVVVVETGSGRLGSVLPVAPASAGAQAIQATYTAGTGTQIGLLSSPIAVAVTNPGVVLVLEAANSQIAAFDLNGNPVPYFPTSLTRRGLLGSRQVGPAARLGAGQGRYTLPLVSTGTYLDLGVDGAGQIYLLYYTGDGSGVADYHIDVYSAAGAVIATNSAGVNVPHFAVDYFRSLFAANYDALVDIATGQPHIDPALGVIEPSMSRFDPSEAKALGAPKSLGAPKPRKPKHHRGHKPPKKHK